MTEFITIMGWALVTTIGLIALVALTLMLIDWLLGQP